ncbi:MAG: hypothetical protein CM1200mP26_00930 [Acidimicrobiales bacterium]|nr:MAG: hypothetical protein CM1200mP26_00930 [Acidimicrobiales bacterium]
MSSHRSNPIRIGSTVRSVLIGTGSGTGLAESPLLVRLCRCGGAFGVDRVCPDHVGVVSGLLAAGIGIAALDIPGHRALWGPL